MSDSEEPSGIVQLQAKLAQVSRAFRPGAPVDTQDLFAGRTQQMNDLIQCVAEPYVHAIVFGERGVGKTSLVTVVGTAVPHVFKTIGMDGSIHVVRENCAEADTFTSLWRRSLAMCPVARVSRELGFGAGTDVELTTGNSLLPPSDFGPGEVVQVLRCASAHIVFIFDEFDRVNDRTVANPMADLLKALSDHHVNATVVIVGVGDSVTEIISAHRSVERCTRQVHMPRMANRELVEILEKGTKIAGMPFSDRAATAIVSLARGFPHYAHLLASEAMKIAVLRHATEVSFDHLAASLDAALSRSFRSLSDSYVQATQSPRRDAMHKHIIVSCALAPTDDQGYFRPSDIVPFAAHILARSRVTTNTFSTHLAEFASQKRGSILKKIGTERNYRYRFSNPLMIPYVLVKGLQAELISPEDLGIATNDRSAV